jgi:hypothetical protein
VEPAVRHRRPELLSRRLGGLDVDVRPLLPQPRDRRRNHADFQRVAVGRRQLGDLLVGLREPVGDGVGVGQKQRAGLGGLRPAGAALEQPHAELALERADLLGDRGLRERQLLAGARERALARDLAERQQPPRVHRHGL